MTKRLASIVLIVVLVGALGVLAGCSSSTKTTPTTPTTPKSTATTPTTPSTGSSVSIVDFAFQPSSLSVPVGTTVTWTNKGATAHTVTFADFDSGQLQPGMTFQHTFATAGTFPYHCSNHTSMTATVTVGGGGTTGTTTTPRRRPPRRLRRRIDSERRRAHGSPMNAWSAPGIRRRERRFRPGRFQC